MTAFRQTKKDEPTNLGWFTKKKLRIQRYFRTRKNAFILAVKVGYEVWHNHTNDLPRLTMEHLENCPPYNARDSLEGAAVLDFHRKLEQRIAKERLLMAEAGLKLDDYRLHAEVIPPKEEPKPLKESDIYDGLAASETKTIKEKV